MRDKQFDLLLNLVKDDQWVTHCKDESNRCTELYYENLSKFPELYLGTA
jgi:hypothetical protein